MATQGVSLRGHYLVCKFKRYTRKKKKKDKKCKIEVECEIKNVVSHEKLFLFYFIIYLFTIQKLTLLMLQSNLDYPDLDYPDFSIIRTFSLVPFFS